jgi:CheY-like chemotaxis protein
VLVVSAAAHDSLLQAKQLGADAFLSKPFDLHALAALAHSLAGHAAQRLS